MTLQTIADEVGVSRMTVSNAFSRPDQLSSELREKILATATRLGYAGPDPTARSLARGRAGTVGILFTDTFSYAFEDEVAAGLRGCDRRRARADRVGDHAPDLRDGRRVRAGTRRRPRRRGAVRLLRRHRGDRLAGPASAPPRLRRSSAATRLRQRQHRRPRGRATRSTAPHRSRPPTPRGAHDHPRRRDRRRSRSVHRLPRGPTTATPRLVRGDPRRRARRHGRPGAQTRPPRCGTRPDPGPRPSPDRGGVLLGRRCGRAHACCTRRRTRCARRPLGRRLRRHTTRRLRPAEHHHRAPGRRCQGACRGHPARGADGRFEANPPAGSSCRSNSSSANPPPRPRPITTSDERCRIRCVASDATDPTPFVASSGSGGGPRRRLGGCRARRRGRPERR